MAARNQSFWDLAFAMCTRFSCSWFSRSGEGFYPAPPSMGLLEAPDLLCAVCPLSTSWAACWGNALGLSPGSPWWLRSVCRLVLSLVQGKFVRPTVGAGQVPPPKGVEWPLWQHTLPHHGTRMVALGWVTVLSRCCLRVKGWPAGCGLLPIRARIGAGTPRGLGKRHQISKNPGLIEGWYRGCCHVVLSLTSPSILMRNDKMIVSLMKVDCFSPFQFKVLSWEMFFPRFLTSSRL